MPLNAEQRAEIMKKLEEPTLPTYPHGANHADPDMQYVRYNFMNTLFFIFLRSKYLFLKHVHFIFSVPVLKSTLNLWKDVNQHLPWI